MEMTPEQAREIDAWGVRREDLAPGVWDGILALAVGNAIDANQKSQERE